MGVTYEPLDVFIYKYNTIISCICSINESGVSVYAFS